MGRAVNICRSGCLTAPVRSPMVRDDAACAVCMTVCLCLWLAGFPPGPCFTPLDGDPEMKSPTQSLLTVVAVLATGLVFNSGLHAAEWSIPMAGNAFRTAPGPGGGGFQRDGTIAWGDPKTVFSVYFHINRPAEMELSINAGTRAGRSTLAATVGEKTFSTVIEGAALADRKIGPASVTTVSYTHLTLPTILLV